MRLGDNREMLLNVLDAGFLQRRFRRQHLGQGLGGAAGLTDADEVGLGDVQSLVHPLEYATPAERIGIVVEFDKCALGGFLAQHRQRLTAQAGAADA